MLNYSINLILSQKHLKSGDHVVLTNCSYGGTNRAARTMFKDLGITTTFVDFTDPAKVKAAIQDNTRMIFSETPSNPTLSLQDLTALSEIAHENNPPIVHVCDSTFATPVITRPIDHGVDITLHSTTK